MKITEKQVLKMCRILTSEGWGVLDSPATCVDCSAEGVDIEEAKFCHFCGGELSFRDLEGFKIVEDALIRTFEKGGCCEDSSN